MGEVKEAVKNFSPKSTNKLNEKAAGSLIDQVEDLRTEVSRLTIIKDEDTLSEGEAELSENTRKAALLRASHSLLTATKVLLEGY